MSIALVSIATSPKYWELTKRMLASVRKFMPYAKLLLFTDCSQSFDVDKQVTIPSLTWPEVTMARYRLLLEQGDYLNQFDHIFWLDTDMEVIAPVSPEDICTEGITATEHYGYGGTKGTPETDPSSATCCLGNTNYFTGSFQGGSREAFLGLCDSCNAMLVHDANLNYVPLWHDESALNAYLHRYPPTRILKNFASRIRIIDKGTPNRPGGFTIETPLTMEGAFTPEQAARLNQSLSELVRQIIAQKKRVDALQERLDKYNKRSFNVVKI